MQATFGILVHAFINKLFYHHSVGTWPGLHDMSSEKENMLSFYKIMDPSVRNEDSVNNLPNLIGIFTGI
jgi:hypothetical protein